MQAQLLPAISALAVSFAALLLLLGSWPLSHFPALRMLQLHSLWRMDDLQPEPATEGMQGFSEEIYDFTFFEEKLLPKWLDRFSVNYAKGQFSFMPDAVPALYGTIDVVHVLATVGQLDHLSETFKDAWSAQMNSFQNATTGFYIDKAEYTTPGTQPYHAAGEATASLALLGRSPRFNNSMYIALARKGPAEWQAFFDSFYHGTSTERAGLYCKSKSGIHACGQVIGSIPSVLAYTTGKDHAEFIRWWAGWIAERTDKQTGTLCPAENRQTWFDCLGGGMATHGIQLGLQKSGYNFPLSDPHALLNFSLGLQGSNGTWRGKIGSLSLDGIFQASRSSLQLQRSRWAEVRRACSLLLNISAAQLNDEVTVQKTLWNNSHALPNALAAVAECAQLFPHMVRTLRPWTCCARYV